MKHVSLPFFKRLYKDPFQLELKSLLQSELNEKLIFSSRNSLWLQKHAEGGEGKKKTSFESVVELWK